MMQCHVGNKEATVSIEPVMTQCHVGSKEAAVSIRPVVEPHKIMLGIKT